MSALLPPPPLPSPAALRLVSRAGTPKVKPPFALTRWDTEANDRALLLDRPAAGEAPTLEAVLAQIPLPETLAPGTMLVVLGDAAPGSTFLGRLWGARVRIPRHVRASALLAAGYRRIGGGVDPKTGNDLTWGYADRADPA